VRFIAIALGSQESSLARISFSLDMVSRSLGYYPLPMFVRVHLPLMWRGIMAGVVLIFIESMKELPAALLLRPFNLETLPTIVYQYVKTEQLPLGALPALMIVLVGLLPLIFFNRSLERGIT
jgi:iron(III) transport system permease protein